MLARASLVERLGKAESRLWEASRFVVLSSIEGGSDTLDVVSLSARLDKVSGVLGRGMGKV